MTAIAARKDVRRQEAVILPFPIAATTKIVEGALVNVNAAGYAVNATDTTGERCVGVASQETDNTTGAAGDADAIVWTGGAIDVVSNFSATIANVGDKVYVVDNQTVDLAAVTTNDVLVGVIVAVLSATKLRVILTPYA